MLLSKYKMFNHVTLKLKKKKVTSALVIEVVESVNFFT